MHTELIQERHTLLFTCESRRVRRPWSRGVEPPQNYLGVFKRAPFRLPKPLLNQFPVRVCSCLLCIYTVFKGAPLRLPKPLSDRFPVRVCSSHFYITVFKGALLRIPEPLSDQFPVRVCSCPFVYEPSMTHTLLVRPGRSLLLDRRWR